MFGDLVKLVGMDYSFEALKMEKAMAMLRYRRARKVAVAFRALEACLALFLLSWLSSRLPSVAHSLRHLYSLLLSPRCVFLFGNAIILTLFAKSGHFSPNPSSDIYDDFLKNSHTPRAGADNTPSAHATDSKSAQKRASADAIPARRELGRSRSEPTKKQELRRTETDVGRAAAAAEEESPEVEMSSEEFRRMIEAFIAKELRFRRQESMAIVLTDRI